MKKIIGVLLSILLILSCGVPFQQKENVTNGPTGPLGEKIIPSSPGPGPLEIESEIVPDWGGPEDVILVDENLADSSGGTTTTGGGRTGTGTTTTTTTDGTGKNGQPAPTSTGGVGRKAHQSVLAAVKGDGGTGTTTGTGGVGRKAYQVTEPIAQAWDSENTNTPLLNSYFRSSPNIKWYWSGCTTLIGINSATREILLYDGYVSHSAIGLTDFDMYWWGKDKIERYVRFLSGYLDQGYRISGLLVTHGHADHMGDIPIIMYLIKAKYPGLAAFPVITDYHTYKNYCSVTTLLVVYPLEALSIKHFRDLVTDLIVYHPGNGAAVPLATVNEVMDAKGIFSSLGIEDKIAQVDTFGDSYSSQYRIYNIASRSYTSANVINLGGFRATAYLMDHAFIPPYLVPAEYRVNAFKIWGANAPDNVEVLFLDSTNKADFVPETIMTDHLFLTWAPTASWTLPDTLMGHNRERTAITVRDRIRFKQAGVHYIVPMHVDDINLGTYDRTVVCNSATWSKIGYWKALSLFKWVWVGWYEPSHPYSLPSVLLSDEQFQSRAYPAYGEFHRFFNPDPPRVGAISLTSAAQSYNASPKYYYFTPQGPGYFIRFALINNRVGLEL